MADEETNKQQKEKQQERLLHYVNDSSPAGDAVSVNTGEKTLRERLHQLLLSLNETKLKMYAQ